MPPVSCCSTPKHNAFNTPTGLVFARFTKIYQPADRTRLRRLAAQEQRIIHVPICTAEQPISCARRTLCGGLRRLLCRAADHQRTAPGVLEVSALPSSLGPGMVGALEKPDRPGSIAVESAQLSKASNAPMPFSSAPMMRPSWAGHAPSICATRKTKAIPNASPKRPCAWRGQWA